MENSQRLRRRNRAIFCRYGVGKDEADAVFNLQVAGWTAEQVAGVLKAAIDLRLAGMAADEVAALLDGAAA